LLGLLVIIFYVLALRPIALKFGFKDLFNKEVRPDSLFFYSITTVLGTGGMLIVSRIDSIMITSMIGLPALAIYSISFYIATVIEVPKRPITQLTTPLISFALKGDNYDEIRRIYSMVSLTQFAAGALLFLGIWINIDFLFHIIPNGTYYAAGKYVVLAIGLGKLVDLASGNNGDIIVMSDHYKFNIILVSILAVLTIISNYLLIPTYGFTGAAIASAISIFFYNLIKFLFIYKKMKLQPFNWLSLIILNMSILIFIMGEFLPHYPVLWIDMLLRTSLVLILFLGVIFKMGIYKFIVSQMR
ncbi:MAG: oligosaccharide flippase family protein, partial [Cyclobacteriaceae bacterium]|nr:oligosaccharide flippase family protein [Cyclobacteriaceae bacterium]